MISRGARAAVPARFSMPIYEYECKKCGSTFEELVFGSETPVCPKCGSPDTDRLLSRCACRFGGAAGSDMPSAPAASGGGCAGCAGGNCSCCGH